MRLRRDLDSGRRRAAGDSRGAAAAKTEEKSVAVLYLENLSGAKEDEYFRDGITEDIITELSKIRGLKIYPRPTVLPYRDKPVTPQQVGRELNAAYVLGGSLRRAGDRLRINAQLMDAHTDFTLWSERYDREMQDVFAVQDEIARKIAEALRVTLSPQEQEALAAKPTQDLQAYDLYLRGRSYARRRTRQDFEFALQLLEHAVAQDPGFALGYAAIANVCAQYHCDHEHSPVLIERAIAAVGRAVELQPDLPETRVAQAWIQLADGKYDLAIAELRRQIERKPDLEGAHYPLCRALFAAGRYQEVAEMAETAIQAAGEDYNVYVPIQNALGALGKEETLRNVRQRRILALEAQLRKVPEDARARVLIAKSYAETDRTDDATREMQFALALRPNDANLLYNCSCLYSRLKMRSEALEVLRKAREAGFRDANWARRDPDLVFLHGDSEFERLFPEEAGG